MKDSIRKQNEEPARQAEKKILEQLERDSKEIRSRKKESEFNLDSWTTAQKEGLIIVGIIISLVLGIAIGIIRKSFRSFLIGTIAVFVILLLVVKKMVPAFDRRREAKLEQQVQQLQAEAEEKIRQAYELSAQVSSQQAAAYEQEVSQRFKRVLSNPNAIAPMTEYLREKLELEISRANADASAPFIEATLVYTVNPDRIMLPGKDNNNEFFDLTANHFQRLNSEMECEALAMALAGLVNADMKTLYPAASFDIQASRTGSEVVLYYRENNQQYVPLRSIV